MISDHSEYKKIQVIGNIDGDAETETTRLMVTALLVRPGKHQYLVKVGDTLLSNTP